MSYISKQQYDWALETITPDEDDNIQAGSNQTLAIACAAIILAFRLQEIEKAIDKKVV